MLGAVTVGDNMVVLFETTGMAVMLGTTGSDPTVGCSCRADCINHHPSTNRHTTKKANEINRLFIFKVRCQGRALSESIMAD